jgi:hypothetical protein
MLNEKSSEQLKEGFRVGEYFVSFPPGEFIEEDKDGNMFVKVDIYKVDKNNAVNKVNGEITPELEQLIGEELNRILNQAVDLYDQENINK